MEARTSIIKNRMNQISRIIAVASGKGGVGKSMVAANLALSLANKGKKVGLLDLDLYGPSAHIILNIHDVFPSEDNGIIPPMIHDLRFMSIVYYTENKPAPFRGIDITNIIIELLAITRWNDLDYLIIDLPPGIGEETLDIIRFIPNCEFLVVTTPSKVALAAVEKLLDILAEMHLSVVGIIENMVMHPTALIKNRVTTNNFSYLGQIAFDDTLEASLGQPSKLLKSDFSKELETIIKKII